MGQITQEIKVPRKTKVIDVDETIWRRLKSAAALKGMTMSQALEEAIGEWLAE